MDPELGASSDDRPAERLGPYRLEKELGRGPLGIVYLGKRLEEEEAAEAATEEDTAPRRAALKLISGETETRDSQEVVKRFASNREALLKLNHPNISKTYDARIADEGGLYFVMEYTPGMPINDYCDHRRLELRERLRLFLDVCRGVEHAHRKEFVHGHLQASNILVTLEEGEFSPKITELGIWDALVGQAEAVDKRRDIYSLGLLLGELLVGAAVPEAESPRPSSQVARLEEEEAAAVAIMRRVNPQKLVRLLRNDLDWITEKVTQKDPGLGYNSVADLAADVSHYLNYEPVRAAPSAPSFTYRLSKTFQKRQTAIVVALALVGIVTTAVVAALLLSLLSDSAEETSAEKIEQPEQAVPTSDQDLEQATQAIGITERRHRSVTLRGHARGVSSVAISPAGTALASGSKDGVMRLWDLTTGTERLFIRGHSSTVACLAFSPDGKMLASGSQDDTVRLWDTHTGQALHTLGGPLDNVLCLAFSPDGSVVACGSKDGSIWLWQADSGAERLVLQAPQAPVVSLAFSGDGKTLASGSSGDALLWDAPSGKELERVGQGEFVAFTSQGDVVVSKRDDDELCFARSPDGDFTASGRPDGAINLGVENDTTVALKEHTGAVLAIAFSDHQTLASASADGTVKLWLLDQWLDGKSSAELPETVRTSLEQEVALEIAKENAWTHFLLARKLAGTERLEEAESEVRQALEIYPSAVFYRQLGRVLEKQQRPSEAVAAYRSAVEKDPHFAGAHIRLASLLRRRAELDFSAELTGFLEFVEKVLDAEKDGPGDFRLLSTCALVAARGPRSEAKEKAIHYAREAVRLSHRRDAATLVTLAKVTKDGKEAVLALETAQRLRPQSVSLKRLLRNSRGRLLPDVASYASIDAIRQSADRVGVDDRIRRNWRRRVQEVNQGQNVAHLLAYIDGRRHAQAGDHESAVSSLKNLLEVDPHRPEPYLRLAESLHAIGQSREAEECLESAFARGLHKEDERLWQLWLNLVLRELKWGPGEILARFPTEGIAGRRDRADLLWVLKQLNKDRAVRLNCGGHEMKDTSGRIWGRDRFFDTGSRRFSRLTRSEHQTLDRTGRTFDKNEGSDYAIPLPSGTYSVSLHFDPDRSSTTRPEPSFSMAIEDQTLLTDYTPSRTDQKRYEVRVNDGALNIQFLPHVGHPTVFAIEVIRDTAETTKDAKDTK